MTERSGPHADREGDGMKHIEKILVTSLKGGVGKSTVSAALAVAFAGLGSRVLLCDLDFRSRSLELMMGTEDRGVFNVYDYATGLAGAKSLIVNVPVRAGLVMFCPAPDEDSIGYGGEEFLRLPGTVSALAEEAGATVVICDTGAESATPKLFAEKFADVALIVSEQSRTSIRAAEITAGKLAAVNGELDVRLVVNDFDVKLANRRTRAGLLEMIDDSSVRCVGVIPHDDSVPVAQDSGILPTFGPVAAAAENTARRLKGENIPLFKGVGNLRRKIKL